MGTGGGELQAMLDSIPYVRSHGFSVAVGDDGLVTVTMPWVDALANIMGGWHASALYCGAETAAGVAAWCIAASPNVLTLVRGASIRYVRRPEGVVTCTARVDVEPEAVRAVLHDTGRSDVRVFVVGTDASGETVLETDFEYALRGEVRA